MLLVLLGLALGFIMELVLESLVRRLLVIALVTVGIRALNNDVGLPRPIPEDNPISSTEIKKEEVKLEDVQLSRSGFGGYALSGAIRCERFEQLAHDDLFPDHAGGLPGFRLPNCRTARYVRFSQYTASTNACVWLRCNQL